MNNRTGHPTNVSQGTFVDALLTVIDQRIEARLQRFVADELPGLLAQHAASTVTVALRQGLQKALPAAAPSDP